MSKDLFTHLIIKSFQGGLTVEEQKMLDQWLIEDESHRLLFDKLKSSWNESEDYKADFHVDLDKGWQSILSKIGNAKDRPKIIPLWRQPAIRIAASLVLLIGLIWAGVNYFGSTSIEVPYTTVLTSKDEIKEITLPDGSMITLNESSRMTYSNAFDRRNVLLDGEALFQVEHDSEHPFTVVASESLTKVLGTTFNVNAYTTDISVSLIEGSVAFVSPEEEEVVLLPGETLNYDADHALLSKSAHETQNFDSWKTGILAFEQTSVQEVITDLEEYFDLDIKLENQSEVPCLFTGTFNNSSYDEILEVLSFTFDLNQSERDGNSYLVINNCQ